MPVPFSVLAFYQFQPMGEETVSELQQTMTAKGEELHIKGLIILATEGINGTIAGTNEEVVQFKKFIEEHFSGILFKEAGANEQPFKRWFVKIRPEIVTIKKDGLAPREKIHKHLSPKEWKETLEKEEVVIIDARNTYETAIGMFEGALDPNLRSFQEFPEFVKKSQIPKDKKVLMYCTGGIRCEKALIEMEEQGYKNVYQLQGGILNYIKEFPEDKFEGECFVFDHRVAVDQSLMPSQTYKLCPHCGDPGKELITCDHCHRHAIVCETCTKSLRGKTCSKNCAYHYERKMVKI